jgi:hypothetical protein
MGCGSRGPLDITGNYGFDSGESDASVQDTGAVADTGADVEPEAGRDAGPLVNCGQCVAQKCGQQFIQCFQSTDCRTTLQCAVQNCFQNGGFDQTCLLNKCGSDLKGFAQLLGVVVCVASNCGQDCIGVLGMGS